MNNTSSISIKKILDTFTVEQWEKIAAYAAGKASEKRKNNAEVTDPTPVEEKKQCKEKEIYVQLSDILKEIGIPANLKGYSYLREAVILAYRDWNYVEQVTRLLYPTLAQKFDTTSSRVERAIRHAMEQVFDCGNFDVLNKYFTYSIHRGKPTNKEAIANLAEYLKLQ